MQRNLKTGAFFAAVWLSVTGCGPNDSPAVEGTGRDDLLAASASALMSKKVGPYSVWYDVYPAGGGKHRVLFRVLGMRPGDRIDPSGLESYLNPCLVAPTSPLHGRTARQPVYERTQGCREPFVSTGAAPPGLDALRAPWTGTGTTEADGFRWKTTGAGNAYAEFTLDVEGDSAHAEVLNRPLTVIIPVFSEQDGYWSMLYATMVLGFSKQLELDRGPLESLRWRGTYPQTVKAELRVDLLPVVTPTGDTEVRGQLRMSSSNTDGWNAPSALSTATLSWDEQVTYTSEVVWYGDVGLDVFRFPVRSADGHGPGIPVPLLGFWRAPAATLTFESSYSADFEPVLQARAVELRVTNN